MIYRIRDYFIIMNVFLLLLFDAGYMQLRIPPSAVGVPLSEVILIAAIFTILPLKLLAKLHSLKIFWPLVCWVIYSVLLVVYSSFDNGIRAFRDGLLVVESLYLLLGFIVAGKIRSRKIFEKYLKVVLFIGFVYILLFPLRYDLIAFVPHLTGAQGQSVPLFFTYTIAPLFLITASAYSIEVYKNTNLFRYAGFSAATLSWVLIVLPSRTVLLLVIVLIGFAVVDRGVKHTGKIIALLVIGFFAVLIFSQFDIGTKKLGISGAGEYLRLFYEIFSVSDSDETISSGNTIRYLWWGSVWDSMSSSWSTIVFGLGYGIPLTNFVVGNGVYVYEPHNTFFGVLGRGGLIGVVLFLWLHLTISYYAYQALKTRNVLALNSETTVALTFIIISVFIYGLGESPLTVSFFSVPFYFSAGILVRAIYERKKKDHISQNLQY